MWSKDHRQAIEWGKNLLILLLLFSAVYLMGRSNLGKSFGDAFGQSSKSEEQTHSRISGQEDQRVWPVRMAVQNDKGRYAVQYDEERLEDLFFGRLGNQLGELLGMTQSLTAVPEAIWREVLLSDGNWVYYDFSGSVPLSRLPSWLGDEGGEENPNLIGQIRSFLLTEIEGQKILYCYSEVQAAYYRCETEQVGGGRLSAAVSQYEPNGMIFAMEQPENYAILWPYEMILPASPTLPTYEASNPLEDLENEQDSLLQDLSFLPKAVSQYEISNGVVIQEGADTLRILNDGTVVFNARSTESNQARYPVENWSVDQAVEESKSILDAVLASRIGEARSYCLGGEELADGRIRVIFGYLLSGAQVLVGSTDWAAEFILQDGYVETFTICLRQYEKLEDPMTFLLEKQALAALAAKDQQNCELFLCYIDSGNGALGAKWFTRQQP